MTELIAQETRRADGPRFASFLAVGGLAALVNIAVRIALSRLVAYEVAVVLAFPAALTTAFLLSKAFVFKTTGSVTVEYGRFLIVNLFALAQVWVVSVVLARMVLPALGFTWHAETAAHAIGVLSPVLTSYYAHKRFTFRTAEREPG